MIITLLLSTFGILAPAPASALPAMPFSGFTWDANPRHVADGAPIASENFLFKFDLNEVSPTQWAPNGPAAFPSSAGGRYSVGKLDDGRTYSIYAFTDGGCCSDHVMSMNLTTGHIFDHHQHSAGPWEDTDAPDPTNADQVKHYLKELEQLSGMLSFLRAPQSVLNYLQQVTYTLEGGQFRAEDSLGNDQVKIIGLVSFNTQVGASVTVAYNTTTDRDILVDVLQLGSGNPATETWLGKGLVHVKAGKGTILVPYQIFKVSPDAMNQVFGMKAAAKILPTGADYTKAVGANDVVLYY